ncbi:MAG: hypothetical protein EA349_15595 [Halomonadaceae bacterium]|nr:MAG: hypothetical protein EA349_15595 [Halomonadaceae bacterium]
MSLSFELQRVVSTLFSFLAHLVARVFVRQSGELHAFILPPTGAGSAGDQAMVQATAQTLSDRGFTRIDVVRYSPEDNWGAAERLFTSSVTWPRKSPFSWVSFALKVARGSHFLTLGADVLDGKYGYIKPWRMLEVSSLAARLGLDTRICGFSLNSSPHPQMIRAFNRLSKKVVCYQWDPVSAQRFRDLTARQGVEVADLAFLLSPENSPFVAEVGEWIDARRRLGDKVMGLNLNYLPFAAMKLQTESVLRQITENVGVLLHSEDNLSLVFVPHDSREERNDVWFAGEIYQRLDGALKPRCRLIERVPEASEIKGVASMLDFAITGRMHFLIALMGSGVPGLGVTYQGKFQGLYQLFDIKGLGITPNEFLQQEPFLVSARNLIAHCDDIQSRLSRQLDAVKKLSMSQLPVTSNPRTGCAKKTVPESAADNIPPVTV